MHNLINIIEYILMTYYDIYSCPTYYSIISLMSGGGIFGWLKQKFPKKSKKEIEDWDFIMVF